MITENVNILQWAIVLVISMLMFILAPRAKDVNAFFKGKLGKKDPNLVVLTSSLVISWIFAKSITNAANLGLSYGIVGGVSYAAYYLSFLVAGVTLYYLRTRGGYNSIHHFLESKFGRAAIFLFSILIGIRLLNEVWSNTMVIGTYFGEQGSSGYLASIIVFTLLTLAYTLKGGMSASLLTDLIQMIMFGFLLIIILNAIYLMPYQPSDYLSSGNWSGQGGVYLLFVALIQTFSYPYHDPVMTDRAFITSPRSMLKGFVLATFLGTVFILLFSLIGVNVGLQGLTGEAPVVFSREIGVMMMLIMNAIMIVSASSTLDSAFTSFGKLGVLDLNLVKQISISKGRLMIVLFTLLGTVPIFFNPTILSATTISGTMVIGLTPIFLLWWLDAPPLSFYLPVLFGLCIGIFHLLNIDMNFFGFDGPYADLLAANLIGFAGSILCYLTPYTLKKIIT